MKFILLAAIGLIAFLLITNTLDFKDKLNNALYPKPASEARGPHRTPKPTSLPTPGPTSSPGPTTQGKFPIGTSIDSSNLSWWNSKALSTDLVIGNVSSLNSVASAKGTRVLFLNPSDPASGIDTAKANGWTVTSNIESTDLNYVISKEKEQYQMAKDRGVTFTFGPTGIQLENSYSASDYALVRNADIIAYQTQRLQEFQGFSVDQYGAKVKDIIGKIKPYIGQHQVRVQVSVNPPGNRCTTADKVIPYIDAITTGSNTADAIVIFVSPQYDSQCPEKRVDVMKKIVEHYR